jgi:hypothetical protein
MLFLMLTALPEISLKRPGISRLSILILLITASIRAAGSIRIAGKPAVGASGLNCVPLVVVVHFSPIFVSKIEF